MACGTVMIWPFLLAAVMSASAYNPEVDGYNPPACHKGDFKLAPHNSCKKFYECRNGHVREKLCSMLQKFDRVHLRCRYVWQIKCRDIHPKHQPTTEKPTTTSVPPVNITSTTPANTDVTSTEAPLASTSRPIDVSSTISPEPYAGTTQSSGEVSSTTQSSVSSTKAASPDEIEEPTSTTASPVQSTTPGSGDGQATTTETPNDGGSTTSSPGTSTQSSVENPSSTVQPNPEGPTTTPAPGASTTTEQPGGQTSTTPSGEPSSSTANPIGGLSSTTPEPNQSTTQSSGEVSSTTQSSVSSTKAASPDEIEEPTSTTASPVQSTTPGSGDGQATTTETPNDGGSTTSSPGTSTQSSVENPSSTVQPNPEGPTTTPAPGASTTTEQPGGQTSTTPSGEPSSSTANPIGGSSSTTPEPNQSTTQSSGEVSSTTQSSVSSTKAASPDEIEEPTSTTASPVQSTTPGSGDGQATTTETPNDGGSTTSSPGTSTQSSVENPSSTVQPNPEGPTTTPAPGASTTTEQPGGQTSTTPSGEPSSSTANPIGGLSSTTPEPNQSTTQSSGEVSSTTQSSVSSTKAASPDEIEEPTSTTASPVQSTTPGSGDGQATTTETPNDGGSTTSSPGTSTQSSVENPSSTVQPNPEGPTTTPAPGASTTTEQPGGQTSTTPSGEPSSSTANPIGGSSSTTPEPNQSTTQSSGEVSSTTQSSVSSTKAASPDEIEEPTSTTASPVQSTTPGSGDGQATTTETPNDGGSTTSSPGTSTQSSVENPSSTVQPNPEGPTTTPAPGASTTTEQPGGQTSTTPSGEPSSSTANPIGGLSSTTPEPNQGTTQSSGEVSSTTQSSVSSTKAASPDEIEEPTSTTASPVQSTTPGSGDGQATTTETPNDGGSTTSSPGTSTQSSVENPSSTVQPNPEGPTTTPAPGASTTTEQPGGQTSTTPSGEPSSSTANPIGGLSSTTPEPNQSTTQSSGEVSSTTQSSVSSTKAASPDEIEEPTSTTASPVQSTTPGSGDGQATTTETPNDGGSTTSVQAPAPSHPSRIPRRRCSQILKDPRPRPLQERPLPPNSPVDRQAQHHLANHPAAQPTPSVDCHPQHRNLIRAPRSHLVRLAPPHRAQYLPQRLRRPMKLRNPHPPPRLLCNRQHLVQATDKLPQPKRLTMVGQRPLVQEPAPSHPSRIPRRRCSQILKDPRPRPLQERPLPPNSPVDRQAQHHLANHPAAQPTPSVDCHPQHRNPIRAPRSHLVRLAPPHRAQYLPQRLRRPMKLRNPHPPPRLLCNRQHLVQATDKLPQPKRLTMVGQRPPVQAPAPSHPSRIPRRRCSQILKDPRPRPLQERPLPPNSPVDRQAQHHLANHPAAQPTPSVDCHPQHRNPIRAPRSHLVRLAPPHRAQYLPQRLRRPMKLRNPHPPPRLLCNRQHLVQATDKLPQPKRLTMVGQRPLVQAPAPSHPSRIPRRRCSQILKDPRPRPLQERPLPPNSPVDRQAQHHLANHPAAQPTPSVDCHPQHRNPIRAPRSHLVRLAPPHRAQYLPQRLRRPMKLRNPHPPPRLLCNRQHLVQATDKLPQPKRLTMVGQRPLVQAPAPSHPSRIPRRRCSQILKDPRPRPLQERPLPPNSPVDRQAQHHLANHPAAQPTPSVDCHPQHRNPIRAPRSHLVRLAPPHRAQYLPQRLRRPMKLRNPHPPPRLLCNRQHLVQATDKLPQPKRLTMVGQRPLVQEPAPSHPSRIPRRRCSQILKDPRPRPLQERPLPPNSPVDRQAQHHLANHPAAQPTPSVDCHPQHRNPIRAPRSHLVRLAPPHRAQYLPQRLRRPMKLRNPHPPPRLLCNRQHLVQATDKLPQPKRLTMVGQRPPVQAPAPSHPSRIPRRRCSQILKDPRPRPLQERPLPPNSPVDRQAQHHLANHPAAQPTPSVDCHPQHRNPIRAPRSHLVRLAPPHRAQYLPQRLRRPMKLRNPHPPPRLLCNRQHLVQATDKLPQPKRLTMVGQRPPVQAPAPSHPSRIPRRRCSQILKDPRPRPLQERPLPPNSPVDRQAQHHLANHPAAQPTPSVDCHPQHRNPIRAPRSHLVRLAPPHRAQYLPQRLRRPMKLRNPHPPPRLLCNRQHLVQATDKLPQPKRLTMVGQRPPVQAPAPSHPSRIPRRRCSQILKDPRPRPLQERPLPPNSPVDRQAQHHLANHPAAQPTPSVDCHPQHRNPIRAPRSHLVRLAPPHRAQYLPQRLRRPMKLRSLRLLLRCRHRQPCLQSITRALRLRRCRSARPAAGTGTHMRIAGVSTNAWTAFCPTSPASPCKPLTRQLGAAIGVGRWTATRSLFCPCCLTRNRQCRPSDTGLRRAQLPDTRNRLITTAGSTMTARLALWPSCSARRCNDLIASTLRVILTGRSSATRCLPPEGARSSPGPAAGPRCRPSPCAPAPARRCCLPRRTAASCGSAAMATPPSPRAAACSGSTASPSPASGCGLAWTATLARARSTSSRADPDRFAASHLELIIFMLTAFAIKY
ncbi:hypothetical protein ONE63_005283 [Megalurothrips usitatus]|uniref:Chitin-binding type-2 domain-containing protein n=1 Tax=Megalurothrips usitatus TaxID=439358 RepID=A0AAV7XVJ1_9NEOP|nr:hypothetical protein ONE63_005283 [Megalurothrips usitatus]